MTATASAELISDVEAAVCGGSPERRLLMLRRLIHLLISSASRLNETQFGIFDDVLVKLIKHTEAQSLVELSSTLSNLSPAPKQAVRYLACHNDIAVAVPVLLRSQSLCDAALAAIASRLGPQHLQAISSRRTLSEALTDVLLKRGRTDVCRVLAKNAGAKFSESGYATIVAAAGPHKDIAELLVLRPDLPSAMLRELLSNATDAVRLQLLKSAPPRLRQNIRQALDDITSDVSRKTSEPVIYSEAYARIVALNNSGKLNDFRRQSFCVATRGHKRHRFTVCALRRPNRSHRTIDGGKRLRRPDHCLSRLSTGLANSIVDYPQSERTSTLRARACMRQGEIRKTLPFSCPTDDTLRTFEQFGHKAGIDRECFRDRGGY